MNRRMLAAAAVAVAMTLAVAACGSSSKGGSGGSGSGGSGGQTTLKLVGADYGTGPSNTTAKYWKAIATAFHQANPSITVDVTVVPWTNFDSEIQTMVQNHKFPDITEGDYFSSYAQQKLLYPASDVLSNPKELEPVFAKQGTYNGTQYGMPFTTSSRTLFYNKKLFAKAGISAAPTTWAEVEDDAAKITKSGSIGYGLPLGPEEAQAESLLWFLGDGGNYQTSAGKYEINSAPNVGAFTFLKGMVAAGDTEPHPSSQNRTPLWERFAQGKIGMINGSPALIPIIKAGGVLTPKDWASVAIPGKTGALATTLGVCDNVAAFKPNGHEAQIKKFLDFAYQSKYQLQFAHEYDLLPATTAAAGQMAKDPEFASFIKALPHSIQYPSDTAWAQVKTQIQNTIGTAVTGSPSSVLGNLQSTAEKQAQ